MQYLHKYNYVDYIYEYDKNYAINKTSYSKYIKKVLSISFKKIYTHTSILATFVPNYTALQLPTINHDQYQFTVSRRAS